MANCGNYTSNNETKVLDELWQVINLGGDPTTEMIEKVKCHIYNDDDTINKDAFDALRKDLGKYEVMFEKLGAPDFLKRLNALCPQNDETSDPRSEPDQEAVDNEDFQLNQDLDSRISRLFSRNPELEFEIRNKFRLEVIENCLVNFIEQEVILGNTVHFNQAIFDYKITNLGNLANWLKNKGYITQEMPQPTENGYVTEQLLSYYYLVLSIANSIFTPDKMEEVSYAFINNDTEYIDAFYAYLILSPSGQRMSFDDILHDEFPKMFSINQTGVFASPANESYQLNLERNTNKPFGKDRMEDGEKTMGILGKLLLITTPKLDENGRQVGYVTYEEASSIMDKFKYALYNPEVSEKKMLREQLLDLYKYPDVIIPKLISTFLNEYKNYRDIINFSIEELNVLRSIYSRFFDEKNENSLINIENKSIHNSDILPDFLLTSSIIGALLRNESSSYAQNKLNDDHRSQIEVMEEKDAKNLTYSFQTNIVREISESKMFDEYTSIQSYGLRFVNNSDAIILTITLEDEDRTNITFVIDSSANNDKKIQILNSDGETIELKQFIKGKENSEYALIFPTSAEIVNYFKYGDIKSKEPGYQIVLKLLKAMCDFLPSLQLNQSNLRVLTNWLAFEYYGESPTSSLYFIKTRLSQILHLVGRNIIINSAIREEQLKIQERGENFDKHKVLIDKFGSLFSGKSKKDYFNQSTNDLKLVWGNKQNIVFVNLAKIWSQTKGDIYKIRRDAQSNALPITRSYTIVNHIADCLHSVADDPETERKGITSPLKFNLWHDITNLYNLGKPCVYIDVTDSFGNVKKVRETTSIEQEYDQLVIRFLGSLLDSDSKYFYIQTTTFADKGTIPIIPVPKEFIYRNYVGQVEKYDVYGFIGSETGIPELKNIIAGTIGQQYVQLQKNLVRDYRIIFKALNEETLRSIINNVNKLQFDDDVSDSIKEKLQSFIEKTKDLDINNIDQWDYETFIGLMFGIDKNILEEIKNAAFDSGVKFLEDVHYTKLWSKNVFANKDENGNRRFNFSCNMQIYHWSKELFSAEDGKVKTTNELEQLYRSYLIRYVKECFKLDLSTNDPNIKMFFQKKNLSTWIDDTDVILAKDKNGKIITAPENINEDSVINPVLESFFYIHYLYTENLNLILSGGSYTHNHKLKLKSIGPSSGITFEKLMILEESGRTTNSFKRTVDQTVPGIIPILDVTGNMPKARFAIMEDIKAPVYNIAGMTDEIDSSDGCSFTLFLYNILLRKSQQDCMGGTVQKLILRDQHSEYGSNVIFKYADDGMFNYEIRNSMSGSGVDLEAKVRQMLSLEFDKEHDEIDRVPKLAKTIVSIRDGVKTEKEYEIDLTKNLFGKKVTPQEMARGQRIIFRVGSRHIELVGLEKVEGEKYTYKPKYREVQLEENGKLSVVKESELAKSMSIPREINTLYQLWKVLGGCYSESVVGNEFVFSDTSCYVLAEYCINIGRVFNTDGQASKGYPTPRSTWQPLKTKFIASLVNLSACKNSADVVNSQQSWFDRNARLRTTILRTNLHLLVQDYDHDVVSGDTALSEFTQVMSATIQYGTSFPEVEELWYSLTKISAAQMYSYKQAVDQILNAVGEIDLSKKNQMYHTICKLLIHGYDSQGRETTLFKRYVQELKNQFDTFNENHENDEFKIPFSDSNAFTSTVIAILGAVNRLSIKRKFEGGGLIMVGSYGMNKNFSFLSMGHMSYTDLLNWLHTAEQKESTVDGQLFEETWQVKGKKQKISVLLTQDDKLILQDNLEYLDSQSAIHLYRIVNTILNSGRNIRTEDVYINGIINSIIEDDDVKKSFGDDLNKLAIEKFRSYIKKIQQLNADAGYELQEVSEIVPHSAVVVHNKKEGTWESDLIDDLKKLDKYQNSDIYDYFYIDYSEARDLLPSQISFKDKETGKRINLYNLKVVRENIEIIESKTATDKEKNDAQNKIDAERQRIYEGKYTANDGTTKEIEPGSLRVTDYEARIPKIFAKEYGIRPGDSLFDILSQGYSFFQKRWKENNRPVLNEQSFDICMTSPTGNHIYVTLKKPTKQKEIPVDRINLQRDEDYIWVTDDDGNLLYPRWRRVREKDGSYKFITRIDEQGNEVLEEAKEDCIVKYTAPGGSQQNFYYCTKPEYASFLYDKNRVESIIISKRMKKSEREDDLFNFLRMRSIAVKGKRQLFKFDDNGQVIGLNGNIEDIINTINDSFKLSIGKAKSKFNSFKKSLDLIVARIPAQNLQSYMKMIVVGFLETTSNQIQVCHLQTYIQGSDYDIDKANTMMLCVRKNGLLYLWSPFFHAVNSVLFNDQIKRIPIPSNQTVTLGNNGIDITSILQKLLNVWPREDNGDLVYSDDIDYWNEKINPIITDLLEAVGKNQTVSVNPLFDNARFVQFVLENIVNRHTKYFSNLYGGKFNRELPTTKDIAKMFRNLVHFRLGYIVTDIRNLKAAQTPVSMGEGRTAADNSPLGKDSKTRIRLLPTTIPQTTEEFLVGKDSVGVTANGSKANFTILYHFMHTLNNGSNNEKRRLLFDVIFNGVHYNSLLHCINPSLIEKDDKGMFAILEEFLESKKYTKNEIDSIMQRARDLSEHIDTSIVISALISAATDNAKELILKAINAEINQLNMYIFGTIIGIPFKEIADLMTSPIINFAINACKENMFVGKTDLKVEDILEEIQHGIKIKETTIRNAIIDSIEDKKLRDFLKQPNAFNNFIKSVITREPFKMKEAKKEYFVDIDIVEMEDKILEKLPTQWYRTKAKQYFRKMREYQQPFKENAMLYSKIDKVIENYSTLQKGGREITNMSAFLKLNQGTPVVPGDLINYLSRLEYIIINQISSQRKSLKAKLTQLYKSEGDPDPEKRAEKVLEGEAAQSIFDKTFSIIDFFNYKKEKQFQQDIIDLMQVTKFAFNILDITIKNPNFNYAFISQFIGVTMINSLTRRGKTMRSIHRQLFPKSIQPPALKTKQWTKINELIDTHIIYEWLSKMRIEIPLQKNDIVYETENEKRKQTILQGDKTVVLQDNNSFATFIYWFEHTLYNMIKDPGRYSDMFEADQINELKTNPLIRDLTRTTFRDNYAGADVFAILIPRQTINFNNYKKSQSDANAFGIYLRAMEKLQNITIHGKSLIDWMFLYYLIMFKNQNRPENMSPLFSNLVKKGFLIDSYYKWQGDKDWILSEVIPKIAISEFRKAVAPIVNANNVSSKELENYECVRLWNSDDSGYVLLKKDKDKTSNEDDDFQIVEEDEFGNVTGIPGYTLIEHLADFTTLNFYRFNLKDYEQELQTIRISENITKEDLIKIIKSQMRENILNIIVNCN